MTKPCRSLLYRKQVQIVHILYLSPVETRTDHSDAVYIITTTAEAWKIPSDHSDPVHHYGGDIHIPVRPCRLSLRKLVQMVQARANDMFDLGDVFDLFDLYIHICPTCVVCPAFVGTHGSRSTSFMGGGCRPRCRRPPSPSLCTPSHHVQFTTSLVP